MSRYIHHPGSSDSCKICRGTGHVIRPVGEAAQAVLCTCVTRCTKCDDTGWIPATDDLRGPRKRCLCAHAKRRMQLFDDAHIPARHAASTLARFEPTSRQQAQVLNRATTYLASYQPGQPNRGLVLHGDVGRGKTHLLCSLIRELTLEHGVSARFVEFSHLVQDLKVAFERGGGAADLFDPLVRVDVLAIDELGKDRNTEFEGTVVDEVVSRRYNADATILASTNYEPGPSSGRTSPNLTQPKATAPRLVDRLGARVYSRLEEMCDFFSVVGDDYRQRHRPWAGRTR